MTSPTASSPFVRVARWCATHRWQTILAWMLAVVAALFVGQAVGTKKIADFRLPGTESQRAYDVLAKHSPKQNGLTDQFVFVARRGTLRDPELHNRIESALARVRRDPVVVNVTSPLAPGGQVTKDGRIGVAMVTYKDAIDEIDVKDFKRVQNTVFSARGPDLQIEHGGQGAEFIRFSESQGGSEFIGLLAAALVLLIVFGSVVAAGVPLLSAVLALGTTLALVPVISQVVDTPDFASQLAALIGLGVGIDYALIVVTRYRAEHERGLSRDDALLRAMDTAGRTVFFAALTVMIALLGLLLLGLSFLQGAALASALAVALTATAALTVLPALLSRAGGWIDRLHLSLPGGRRRRSERALRRDAVALAGESAAWGRWSEVVQRRPWAAIVVSLLILLGLAVPALHMRLGSSDAGLDPEGTTTRKAYDLVAQGFGAGTNGSFLLAVELPRPGDVAAAQQVAAAVAGDPDVAFVTPPQLSGDREIATIVLFPKTGPQEEETTKLLDRLREQIIPPLQGATGAHVSIGGQTASQEDFTATIASKLPLFVGMVVLLSALLLMAVFRSVLIPIKAALMNLLSIGAALGFVTLVFQDGIGSDLLGAGTGPVESFVPVMLFAIVFGLSMDYEMFLVSRIHEEWLRTGEASRAVRNGLATTGRVITAAAAIMIVVFLSFGLGTERVIKEFGLGLAMAVLLDALVIRCLLVPALMQLLGRRAWWFPSWLDRLVPRLALESE
ncbi:MAG: putative drug exporter of the superfamily [Solirubrobacteraceae bacterium]|jgi:RND superfamily putative drug exporter|nr:putative drug exporter of the superfamily [Solirubrobacteraceae bacterium]